MVCTAQARSKIRQWFKKEKRSENIVVGRNEVEREVKRLSRLVTDEKMDEIIATVAKRVGINSADDFYNTLGFGGLSLQRFMPKIKEEVEKLVGSQEQEVKTTEGEISKLKVSEISHKKKSSGGVIIDGEPGCAVKFAKCCNPLPGDSIVGFITRGFGVSIHKTDCPNVSESRRNEENLSRWVKAEWESVEASLQNNYEASLQIVADDQIGVFASISSALADMKVSITQIYTSTTKSGGAVINLHVACRSTSHIDSIVSRLRSIKSVISVQRGFVN